MSSSAALVPQPAPLPLVRDLLASALALTQISSRSTGSTEAEASAVEISSVDRFELDWPTLLGDLRGLIGDSMALDPRPGESKRHF